MTVFCQFSQLLMCVSTCPWTVSTYPASGQVDTIWVMVFEVNLLLVVYLNQNSYALYVLLKCVAKI